MNREQQKIHEAIDHDVIRAVAALRQQRTVAREQNGQTVFVSGTEAAREYLLETLACALEAGDAIPPATPEPRELPRRCYVDQWTPAERAIQAAVDVVESMGADVRLSWAVSLLSDARRKVADFVDGVQVAIEDDEPSSVPEGTGATWQPPLRSPVSQPPAASGDVEWLIDMMLNLYGVKFTDAHSRKIAVESWARQFRAVLVGDHSTPGGTK